MGKYVLYILFFFLPAIFFGQDILMDRDSTKIEVKILEISAANITYKQFNYQWGAPLVVNKDEFAYVIYQNGHIERFVVPPKPDPKIKQIIQGQVSVSSKHDSLRKAGKIGDYIKFNVYAGMVINNAYSNLERYHSTAGYSGYDRYKYDYNYNINVGFNFIFGKNNYIKPVIGINYLRSKGKYDYSHSYEDYSNSYSSQLNYVSKIDFINFTTGLRFVIVKHLCIEPLVSFNLIARSDIRYSGIRIRGYDYIAGYPLYYARGEEITLYNNEKAGPEAEQVTHTFSFCPRIAYEFKVKQQPVGVYFSYNIAYRFRLPWYMIGVTYYPFKKLR